MANALISAFTQIWNNVATTFTAIKCNVTDTASASGSLLMDLQVGGVSRFTVNAKSGKLSLVKPSIAGFTSTPLISLRAPVNEINSRFISFYGPDSITEQGHISSSSGHYGVNFTGTYHSASASIQCQYGTANGSELRTGGLRLSSSLSVAWGTVNSYDTPDLHIVRDAANTLAQRNGTAAQAFNIYNTYTDASNYERGFMRWSSNALQIGTEALGTGTQRETYITGSGSGFKVSTESNAPKLFCSGGNFHIQPGNGGGFSGALGVYTTSTGIAIDAYNGTVRYGCGEGQTAYFVGSDSYFRTAARTGASVVISAGRRDQTNLGTDGSIYIKDPGDHITGTATTRIAITGGKVLMPNLPTSNPAVAGALWNNAGILSIA